MSNRDYNSPNILFGNELGFDNLLSYVLHLYSVKVTPLRRRIIESFFLFIAVLSLFILVESHRCLNQVSSDYLSSIPRSSLRDEIIRIEVASLKVTQSYDLEDSYFKVWVTLNLQEYMMVDVHPEHYLPLKYFLNITKNQCPANKSPNFYYQKTAKTGLVFAETLIEYSTDYSLLRLSPRLREIFGIPVHHFLIDSESLFSKPRDSIISQFPNLLIGMDILVLKSLSQYSRNFTGYARDVVNGLSYSFSGGHQFGIELLALSVLTCSVFTFSIFFLINFAYNQIYFLIVNIIQRSEINRAISVVGGALTVILAFVGIELIISDFFQNAIVSCYVILLLWWKNQFDSLIMNSPTARAVFYPMTGICELLFYMHHYRYSGVLDRQALFTCWLFVIHNAFFCFHHYALPDFARSIRGRSN